MKKPEQDELTRKSFSCALSGRGNCKHSRQISHENVNDSQTLINSLYRYPRGIISGDIVIVLGAW